ncbi:MAG: YHYH protein, partial [Myxococcales bacterium]|nr:YHYH protein [Myxococcales bacterium]
APGAPTIGAVTAGDGSATVAFSAPASNGGAAITSYTATCTASSSSRASGASSPITVTGLTNGTAYACSVTATNSVGTSSASTSASVTPAAILSTAGVLCSYSSTVFNSSPSVNATATATWSCSSTLRSLTANGLPDHAVGSFPNPENPNTIAAQNISVSVTMTPTPTNIVTPRSAPPDKPGIALNGIVFDPGTAGTCNDTGASCSLGGASVGSWNIEALGQTTFRFGTDSNQAHVQPGGVYHYHGVPEGLFTKLGGGNKVMTLIGWAADGFPIYGRYGYSVPTDASSAIKVVTASYRIKSTPDANRPSVSQFPMGAFTQDYEYVAGSGDLDQCNGRTGVTPEFPKGIYHYYATDTYPFLQRCVKGKL